MRRTTSSRCSCSAPGRTSSIGVTRGGLPTIRSSPSTVRHSLASARMLSFVRAPATVDWRRFICLPDSLPELVADRRDVEARVPDVDVPHLGEARHRFAVFAHRRLHGRAAGRVVEAALPAGDREAGGEPLHVPLERPRQRLVEVVEAEDEPPVGCGEDAEVREVRVAAELGVQIPSAARPRGRPPSGTRPRGRRRTGTPACARTGSGRAPEDASAPAPRADRPDLCASAPAPNAACAERGSSERAAFPRAALSPGVKCGTAFGRDGASSSGAPSSRTSSSSMFVSTLLIAAPYAAPYGDISSRRDELGR